MTIAIKIVTKTFMDPVKLLSAFFHVDCISPDSASVRFLWKRQKADGQQARSADVDSLLRLRAETASENIRSGVQKNPSQGKSILLLNLHTPTGSYTQTLWAFFEAKPIPRSGEGKSRWEYISQNSKAFAAGR